MKILSLNTKIIYDIQIKKGEENIIQCPECHHLASNKRGKELSFNASKGVGSCHRCNASFVEFKLQAEKKVYVIPEYKNETNLNENQIKYFAGRMISKQILDKFKISNAREYMPQVEKEMDCICFPYYRNGELINIKYRDGAKHFKLYKGAELTFFNIDSVTPHEKEVIITEGEIDCMSFAEAGFKPVVSVPNGAGGKGLEYFDDCYDNFSEVERFYLATDNDMKGIELREELIRRIGAERCYVVNFGDCKDGNEYLVKHSAVGLSETIKTAKPVPVKDIVNLDDIYDNIYYLYQNGLQPGKKLMIPAIDNLMTWDTGKLIVTTGIPGHGKSAFFDFVISRLNILHGWKAGICSPENYPTQNHFAKIASALSGKSFSSKYLNQAEFEKTYSHIKDNFFWIFPEQEMGLQNILDKAKVLIRKHGIKILLVDPYNKLERTKDKGESDTDYIGRMLDTLSLFSKQHDLLVILVAHPRKMNKDKGTKLYERPSLYDISGSSTFYDKPDYGIVVFRNYTTKHTELAIPKVRFNNLGEGGECELDFCKINNRYFTVGTEPDYETYIGRNFTEQEIPFIQTGQDEMPF
jgi:twinkle protein